jgi:acylphosphatase
VAGAGTGREAILKQAKRYRVHGKVQGVGFRFFALTCAEALQLSGWVRNAADGQLEAHAEGPEGKLAEFEFDLSRGPRFARVERVDQEEVPVEDIDGFEVLR